MVKETDIQTRIKDGFIELGGYARKVSNMYVNGVPDLYCCLPPRAQIGHVIHRQFMVEVKKLDALPVKDETLVTFAHPLTILQNDTIIKINEAGGCAGWWVVFKVSNGHLIYGGITAQDRPSKASFVTGCVHKHNSQKWATVIPELLKRQTTMVLDQFPMA